MIIRYRKAFIFDVIFLIFHLHQLLGMQQWQVRKERAWIDMNLSSVLHFVPSQFSHKAESVAVCNAKNTANLVIW
jgi:hypothetical protein